MGNRIIQAVAAVEVFFANEYPHYGRVELPKQLAAVDYSVIRWFFK